MMREKAADLITEVRNKVPLVHNITNYVTVNDCANVLLAIGASPIMADDIKEAGDITSIASALVLNMGTLNARTVESMVDAGKRANKEGIPVILDPVGAGASSFRNETVIRLLREVHMTIIRGNLSEVSFIAGLKVATKGVDSAKEDEKNDAALIGRAAASQYSCITAVTGAVDVITDGNQVVKIHNGHPMLSKVTGTGCMTTALTGAFAAVTKDYLAAAAAGVAAMGIAGQRAYEKAGSLGTGSFHVAIIDALSKMDENEIKEMAQFDEK